MHHWRRSLNNSGKPASAWLLSGRLEVRLSRMQQRCFKPVFSKHLYEARNPDLDAI